MQCTSLKHYTKINHTQYINQHYNKCLTLPCFGYDTAMSAVSLLSRLTRRCPGCAGGVPIIPMVSRLCRRCPGVRQCSGHAGGVPAVPVVSRRLSRWYPSCAQPCPGVRQCSGCAGGVLAVLVVSRLATVSRTWRRSPGCAGGVPAVSRLVSWLGATVSRTWRRSPGCAGGVPAVSRLCLLGASSRSCLRRQFGWVPAVSAVCPLPHRCPGTNIPGHGHQTVAVWGIGSQHKYNIILNTFIPIWLEQLLFKTIVYSNSSISRAPVSSIYHMAMTKLSRLLIQASRTTKSFSGLLFRFPDY